MKIGGNLQYTQVYSFSAANMHGKVEDTLGVVPVVAAAGVRKTPDGKAPDLVNGRFHRCFDTILVSLSPYIRRLP
jgi:hypothetical protein